MGQERTAIGGAKRAFASSPPAPCHLCARAAAAQRDPLNRPCIRPGPDKDDRNRALNPYYRNDPSHKFAFRLKDGKHHVLDDALRIRGTAAFPHVRVNYGIRRKIGTDTYVYCFAVSLEPREEGKFVSGWMNVDEFEKAESDYLMGNNFKVCKFGKTPKARDCTWKISNYKPSWSYLKVTPYRPPNAPRRSPQPTDTPEVKNKLKRQKATRKRWLLDYKGHMKAGDYFAVDKHVNVLFSLPGNGGKSLGTPPVGTLFCRSHTRRGISLYKRKGTKKVRTMYFVFGHYKVPNGRIVAGWIAEKALEPRRENDS